MLEWTLYRRQFSAPEMLSVWSVEETVGGWLRAERAIAECQEEIGLIPPGAAARLADISAADIDKAALADDMDVAGRPIVGLLRQIRELAGPELAPHIHFGVSTQDIMDTGMVLQMKAGAELIFAQTDRLESAIEALALEHADTPMTGRTNGQHAAPITFGLKLNVWRSELARRRAAAVAACERGLKIQLGGPVGNLKSFDSETGAALKKAVAERLELGVCDPHWQNARDGAAEIISSLGLLCGSLSKIARNINLLSSSDIGELREAPGDGKGASSSMEHKRNQRCSEFAEAVSRLGRQRAQDIHEAAAHEHERSGGNWIAEWVITPQVFLLCSGGLMWMERLFSTLEVDKARMRANLDGFMQSK